MIIDCIVKSTVARVYRVAGTLTNVFQKIPSELPWLENISIYDPLPNQHVNIKQESSREPLKACKTLDISFVFTPSHFLFLPLQFFEIISFPYKSELPQIRGQLLFSCINLNFNYRAHMGQFLQDGKFGCFASYFFKK